MLKYMTELLNCKKLYIKINHNEYRIHDFDNVNLNKERGLTDELHVTIKNEDIGEEIFIIRFHTLELYPRHDCWLTKPICKLIDKLFNTKKHIRIATIVSSKDDDSHMVTLHHVPNLSMTLDQLVYYILSTHPKLKRVYPAIDVIPMTKDVVLKATVKFSVENNVPEYAMSADLKIRGE